MYHIYGGGRVLTVLVTKHKEQAMAVLDQAQLKLNNPKESRSF